MSDNQLSFEGNNLHNVLTNQGYALIDHGISSDEIDALIAEYANFTDKLPDPEPKTMNRMILDTSDLDKLNYSADTQKEWHKYRTNHPQWAKPGGYTNRSYQTEVLRGYGRQIKNKLSGEWENAHDDPKEFYHFHPNRLSMTAMQEMHERYGWGKIPPEVYSLHQRFTTVHMMARQAITATYSLLEENHPDLLGNFATEKDLFGSPIRLLFYHHGQSEMLANGHTDKGLGTIQIAESHLGLRVREPNKVTPELVEQYRQDPVNDPYMHFVKRPPEKGVFFMAKAWENPTAYPDSELKALWHDVVNLTELNEGRLTHGQNCARWAIIFFTNSENAGLVEKTQTHTESNVQVA